MTDFIIAIISFCLAHDIASFVSLYVSLHFFTVFTKRLIKESYQLKKMEGEELIEYQKEE